MFGLCKKKVKDLNELNAEQANTQAYDAKIKKQLQNRRNILSHIKTAVDFGEFKLRFDSFKIDPADPYYTIFRCLRIDDEDIQFLKELGYRIETKYENRMLYKNSVTIDGSYNVPSSYQYEYYEVSY